MSSRLFFFLSLASKLYLRHVLMRCLSDSQGHPSKRCFDRMNHLYPTCNSIKHTLRDDYLHDFPDNVEIINIPPLPLRQPGGIDVLLRRGLNGAEEDRTTAQVKSPEEALQRKKPRENNKTVFLSGWNILEGSEQKMIVPADSAKRRRNPFPHISHIKCSKT